MPIATEYLPQVRQAQHALTGSPDETLQVVLIVADDLPGGTEGTALAGRVAGEQAQICDGVGLRRSQRHKQKKCEDQESWLDCSRHRAPRKSKELLPWPIQTAEHSTSVLPVLFSLFSRSCDSCPGARAPRKKGKKIWRSKELLPWPIQTAEHSTSVLPVLFSLFSRSCDSCPGARAPRKKGKKNW